MNRFFSSRTQYNTTRNSFVVFRNITPSLQLTIYLSIRQPTYLSIYLSLHLSKLSLSFYLSIHLPIFLFVYHCICPSIYLLLSLTIYPKYLFIHLSMHSMDVYVSLWLCIHSSHPSASIIHLYLCCPSINLSIHLSNYLSSVFSRIDIYLSNVTPYNLSAGGGGAFWCQIAFIKKMTNLKCVTAVEFIITDRDWQRVTK